jgi:hypothetical protein
MNPRFIGKGLGPPNLVSIGYHGLLPVTMGYQAGNLERVNRRRLSFANASAEDALHRQKRFEGGQEGAQRPSGEWQKDGWQKNEEPE